MKCIPCKPPSFVLILCSEEHPAAPLPSWPAGGQREQLYKSWLYKNTARRSSWELTLPRQPQTVNYRELTWFLRSLGTSNSQTGSIKPLASLQICFPPLCHLNSLKTAGRLLGLHKLSFSFCYKDVWEGHLLGLLSEHSFFVLTAKEFYRPDSPQTSVNDPE